VAAAEKAVAAEGWEVVETDAVEMARAKQAAELSRLQRIYRFQYLKLRLTIRFVCCWAEAYIEHVTLEAARSWLTGGVSSAAWAAGSVSPPGAVLGCRLWSCLYALGCWVLRFWA
jgi:hypothetical protein